MDLIEFVNARLDEWQWWAVEASRKNQAGCTPTGEHWQWFHPDTDEILTIDPIVDEYVGGRGSADLRSVEEYPTSSSLRPLPRFVVPYAEEVDSTVAGHIVRHDPATVVRQVKAMRGVLNNAAIARGVVDSHKRYPTSEETRSADERVLRIWTGAVAMLATTWSEHPDYDPSWAGEW
jgi:hypothetical protein